MRAALGLTSPIGVSRFCCFHYFHCFHWLLFCSSSSDKQNFKWNHNKKETNEFGREQWKQPKCCEAWKVVYSLSNKRLLVHKLVSYVFPQSSHKGIVFGAQVYMFICLVILNVSRTNKRFSKTQQTEVGKILLFWLRYERCLDLRSLLWKELVKHLVLQSKTQIGSQSKSQYNKKQVYWYIFFGNVKRIHS